MGHKGKSDVQGDETRRKRACSYTVTSTLLNAGAPVPTLSEWAMAGLAGLMMIGGAFFLRRRNLTQKI